MKQFYLTCTLVLLSGLSFAEGTLLRGRVTDAETGHGLVSAFIALKKNATTFVTSYDTLFLFLEGLGYSRVL